MAVNNYSDRQNNEIDELFSAIIGVSENSSKRDKAIENAAKIIKDATDLMSKATHSLENSMTFATKEMNKSFNKHSSSFAKAQNDAILKLNAEKSELADTIHELDKALEDLNVAEKSGKYVDLATKNAIQQKRDIADYHLKQLNSIKGEQAYKIQVANELKKKSLGILSNLANSVVQIFTQAMSNAYNSLSSSWETNFSTITSYQNFSKNEVNAMIDSVQQMIKDNRLDGTISAKDYMDEYSKILQGGIRDSANSKLATKMAYYSVMSKEGGISINFSDTDIQKHIVKIADEYGEDAAESIMESFMTNSKAVADVVGNNFGFVNGQIDVMAQSFYRLYEVTDMTPEGADKAIESMTALNGVLGKTGLDVSKIYEEILSYAESGFSSSGAGTLLKYAKNYTADEMKAAIKEGNIGQVITDTVSGIYDQFGVSKNSTEFKKAINEALGTNYTAEEIDSLLNTYKDKDAFTSAFREAQAAAAGATEEAYYENTKRFHTQQEDFNNRMEGWMTDLVQFSKSNGIVVETIANSIISLVGAVKLFGKGGILNSGTWNKIKALFSGSSGKVAANAAMPYSGQSLASFGGSAGGGAGALGKIGSLFNNGTAFASKGGSLAKVGSKVFSTGGKALGVAGSLISMGLDAYSGYQEDGATGAIRGAITGSGKAAESGWDVAKGAGSGALKGAGIGMLFGPLGMAIGAAVGGLAGLAVGLQDLYDEERIYAKQVESLTNTVNALEESEKKRIESHNKLINTESLVDRARKGEEDALRELAKTWPSLNRFMGESADTNEEYAKTLDMIIALENKKAFNDIYSTYGSAYTENGTSAGSINSIGEKSSGDIKIKKDVEDLTFSSSSANVDKVSKNKVTMTWYNDMLQQQQSKVALKDTTFAGYWGDDIKFADEDGHVTQLSKSDILAMLSESGIDTTALQNSDHTVLAGYLISNGIIKSDGVSGGQAEQAEKNYSNYVSTANYDAALENYRNIYSSLISPGDLTYLLNDGTRWIDIRLTGSDGKTLDKTAVFDTFFSGLIELNKLNKDDPYLFTDVTGQEFDMFKSSYVDLGVSPKAIYDKFKDEAEFSYVPPFAVGLDTVPYDNFYARLHKGERIMTAAEVSLDKARSALDYSPMISQLSDALVYQTDLIIGILDKIYKSISGRPSGLTGEFDTSLKSIASSI